MSKMQVKAGEKLLAELGEEQKTALWNHLKDAKYIKLKDFLRHAKCTRQTGQRLMDGLVEYGILDLQSSYWKTSEKWRLKWALERANKDPDEDEEDDEDPSSPPPTPKQPVKPKPDPPKGIVEGGVVDMMRQSAEQDVAEEERKTYEDQTGQRPSLPRKRGSIPTRKSMTTRKKPGRK